MNKQSHQIVFMSGESVDIIFVGNKQLVSSTHYNKDVNYSKPINKAWFEKILDN